MMWLSPSRSPNTQLPLRSGPVSSRRCGFVSRMSVMRVSRFNRSGQISTLSSARSAAAITGTFDQGALPKLRVFARTVVTRPRSTSRSPAISKLRPVCHVTMRSMGPRSQFHWKSSASTTRHAASAPSTSARVRVNVRRSKRLRGEGASSMAPSSCVACSCIAKCVPAGSCAGHERRGPVQGARRGVSTCWVTATKWQTLPAMTKRCQMACE